MINPQNEIEAAFRKLPVAPPIDEGMIGNV
jgi:hypothetical protein